MLNVFLELATEAGSIIKTFFENGDYKTEFKEDSSPGALVLLPGFC